MAPINIAEIEQQARELRAQELHRIHRLVAEYLGVYRELLGTAIKSGAAAVRDGLHALLASAQRTHRHP